MNTHERIEMALGAMLAAGPRDLRAYLAQPGPDVPRGDENEVDNAIDLLLASDPNGFARLRFSNLLRAWDNARDVAWIGDTPRNTRVRRKLINERLNSGPDLERRIDELMPYYDLDEPMIIAADHKDWYQPQAGVRDYYWSRYTKYLQERRQWDLPSLLSLDNHTRAIIENLADPESPESYASRGLVMGYVQSGKTANFMGVAARAADAGYRLIIVLAGTWNILRNQTQRRFDKELLGKELLRNDEAYTQQQPTDWEEFLEHGDDPAVLGHYTWQRLTRPDIDFRRLRSAIDNLEFEKRNSAARLFDVSNLHSLPVKLLVVKKHSGILNNLVKDLRLIRTKLADLPTLIIDDESDQAGLNTVDPKRRVAGGAERSKTNSRIVDLLGLFPRGQYVGYTATPYANALVKPDDPEDLYPRDFILPLDRPRGYMGISDFFDPTVAYDDLTPNDFSQAEIAHIRRVTTPIGSDNEELKLALRSYVLAGAIKLFRLNSDRERYKAEHFKHHTMLIHTSSRRGEMTTTATRLKDLWDECAFNGPGGAVDLRRLWDDDYSKACAAINSDLWPSCFDDLIPYLSEAIKRIEKGQKIYFVVNSDTPEAPDFSAAPVWKIVIGGNKLSRGYTIEGLTVSYYRRVAGTADTLMQMGRWFGFRPGYRDLVRVFLGVAEGKRGTTDLVSLFKDVCRMEERFREDIQRYVRRPGVPRITPSQVPALISVIGSLPPTARNKMFNAVVVKKNFGGQTSMQTLAPTVPQTLNKNIQAMTEFIVNSKPVGKFVLGGTSAKQRDVAVTAIVRKAANNNLISFLKSYRWLESEFPYPKRPADTELQIEFLEKQNHGISSWLIIAPQRKVSFGSPLSIAEVGSLMVKERHREEEGRGFQVFGEPLHRIVARFFAGIDPGNGKDKLASPNRHTAELQGEKRGVILLYLVREGETEPISVGFELFFPPNDLPFDFDFTVRRESEKAKIVVDEAAA
jgi:hypothetical protein